MVMKTNRRTFLKGVGGTLAPPFLESTGTAAQATPTRFLVVGNPFGMQPDFFFPEQYGRFGEEATLSPTLKSLDWVEDRITVLGHTDHNMVSGHGREIGFLSGVLPTDAQAFAEKNMSSTRSWPATWAQRPGFPRWRRDSSPGSG